MEDPAADLEKLLPAAGAPLPAGRLVRTGENRPIAYWLSDGPAPPGLWPALHAAASGLWPLLLEGMHAEPDRPWVSAELGQTETSAPDDHDPDEALAALWRRLIGSADTDEALRPEVMGWRDWGDVGTPYDRAWPGLAPGLPVAEGAAEAAADYAAEQLVEFARAELRLGLVATPRGADAIALLGWGGPLNLTNDVGPLAAVLRSWEDRFGARVVSIGFDTLTLSVGSPPTDVDHAIHVAAEHFAFCPDNIWQSSTDSLTSYGEYLCAAPTWSFWWD